MYIRKISWSRLQLQVTQVTFIYDESSLSSLEKSLSPERFGSYLVLASNDRRYAISLYEWNTRISEALYGVMQGLEVTLRNYFHLVLTTAYARDDWYEMAPLLQEQKKQIEEAKKRISDDGRTLTPARIVAELMFGFWTSLVGTAYAQTLWDKHLNKAFPGARVSRKAVAQRLKKIRFLRNRVAHHESIIGKVDHERNLNEDFAQIVECIGWICPTTAAWVVETASFDRNYAGKPIHKRDQGLLDLKAAESKR